MHVMTQRQDDTSAPARGAEIIPFRRPETSPVPTPAPHSDESDDDGPSAA
jgi:hypothetical protein